MEINNHLAGQPPAIKPSTKDQSTPPLALQSSTYESSGEIEKDHDSDDSVMISEQAQRLNQSANSPSGPTLQPLQSSEEAQNILAQLISNSKNNPEQMLGAMSNVRPGRVQTVLG